MNVIHENILVQIPKVDDKTNGVFIPEEEQVAERHGIVVRFGEGVPSQVQMLLGTKPRIEYKEYYDGSEITIEGVDYIVMNYKDILIIL